MAGTPQHQAAVENALREAVESIEESYDYRYN